MSCFEKSDTGQNCGMSAFPTQQRTKELKKEETLWDNV